MQFAVAITYYGPTQCTHIDAPSAEAAQAMLAERYTHGRTVCAGLAVPGRTYGLNADAFPAFRCEATPDGGTRFVRIRYGAVCGGPTTRNRR